MPWRQVLLTESTRMFALLTGNDPRPHYFHQSNLTGAGEDGGIFYGLIDTLLNLYRSLFAPNAPLLQPTLRETGEFLTRGSAWRAAIAANSVGGYIDGPRMTVFNRTPASLEVPLSGTEVGGDYGGMRSGWIRVEPGETVVAAL
jgi:hypothetical protein